MGHCVLMKIRGNSGWHLIGALFAALLAAVPTLSSAGDFYGDVQIRAEDIEAHNGSSVELGSVWLNPHARRPSIHSLRQGLPTLEGESSEQQRNLQTLDPEVAGFLTFEDNFLAFSQQGNSTAAEDLKFELATLNPAVSEQLFQQDFLYSSGPGGTNPYPPLSFGDIETPPASLDDSPELAWTRPKSGLTKFADGTQVTLDVASIVPFIGTAADGINATISVGRLGIAAIRHDGDAARRHAENAALSGAGFLVPGASAGALKGAKYVGGEIVEKSAKRGPKIDPGAPHNKKIREVADTIEAEGGSIIGGGGRHPERLIPTPGGEKTGRRPDILYVDSCGILKGCNIGKVKVDGSPIKRESQALDDLNGPGGLPTTFESYE